MEQVLGDAERTPETNGLVKMRLTLEAEEEGESECRMTVSLEELPTPKFVVFTNHASGLERGSITRREAAEGLRTTRIRTLGESLKVIPDELTHEGAVI